jgi:UDP-N-acetylmuramyl pentapeptide synthase
LSRAKVDQIILFGPDTDFIEMEFLKRKGDASKIMRADSLEAIKYGLNSVGKGDTILVKGSRALELERIFD